MQDYTKGGYVRPQGPQEIPVNPRVPVEVALPSAPPKPHVKSKTIQGIVVAAIGFGTMLVTGMDWSFLSDGFQWEDVGPILTGVGAVVTAYGIRTAKQPIEGIVK